MIVRINIINARLKSKIDVQSVFQMLIDFHDSGLVAAPIAVVWRTEDGDDILLVAPVVAL